MKKRTKIESSHYKTTAAFSRKNPEMSWTVDKAAPLAVGAKKQKTSRTPETTDKDARLRSLLDASELTRIEIMRSVVKSEGYKAAVALCRVNKELERSICGNNLFWVACIEIHFGLYAENFSDNPFRSDWANRAVQSFMLILRSGNYKNGFDRARAANDARRIFLALQKPIEYPEIGPDIEKNFVDGICAFTDETKVTLVPFLHFMFPDIAKEDNSAYGKAKTVTLEDPVDFRFGDRPILQLTVQTDQGPVVKYSILDEIFQSGNLATAPEFEAFSRIDILDMNKNWIVSRNDGIDIISRSDRTRYRITERQRGDPIETIEDVCFVDKTSPNMLAIFSRYPSGQNEPFRIIAKQTPGEKITFSVERVIVDDLSLRRGITINPTKRTFVVEGKSSPVFELTNYSLAGLDPVVKASFFPLRVSGSYVVARNNKYFLLLEQTDYLEDDEGDDDEEIESDNSFVNAPKGLFIWHFVSNFNYGKTYIRDRLVILQNSAILIPQNFLSLYHQKFSAPVLSATVE